MRSLPQGTAWARALWLAGHRGPKGTESGWTWIRAVRTQGWVWGEAWSPAGTQLGLAAGECQQCTLEGWSRPPPQYHICSCPLPCPSPSPRQDRPAGGMQRGHRLPDTSPCAPGMALEALWPHTVSLGPWVLLLGGSLLAQVDRGSSQGTSEGAHAPQLPFASSTP